MAMRRSEQERGRQFSRRAVMRASALGAAGLAGATLIGCTGEDEDATAPPSPEGTTSPVSGATSAPTPPEVSGGMLRVAMLSDLTALEPHIGIRDHNDTINQVWDTPTEHDENLEPTGRLFESWEINDEFTEMVFHVRPGVKWHTGRDFTSADVVYNMDRVRAEGTGFGQLRGMAILYDSYDAPDDMTIVFRSNIPRLGTFDFLEQFRIGDPEWLESEDATRAVGTGPFMLGEWRPGDQFNLLRFPDYWEEGVPLLDEIVYSVSLEAQTAVTQLEAGAQDAVMNPPVRDFLRWQDSGQMQTRLDEYVGAYHNAGLNNTYPPFDDVRVRQAMQWATDRERFVNVAALGLSTPLSLPWPEGSAAYEAEKANYYSYDPERARQMLDAAGVTSIDGAMIVPPHRLEVLDFAEMYQEDLAQIGVTMGVEVVEVANYVERINASPPDYRGIYLGGSSRANAGQPVTMINLTNVLYGPTQHEGGWGNCNTGYYSEQWENLIGEINATADPEHLRSLYSQMNDILLEDSWILFLGSLPSRVGLASNVRGVFDKYAEDGFRYREAYLE